MTSILANNGPGDLNSSLIKHYLRKTTGAI